MSQVKIIEQNNGKTELEYPLIFFAYRPICSQKLSNQPQSATRLEFPILFLVPENI